MTCQLASDWFLAVVFDEMLLDFGHLEPAVA
jgi:hypothetical protein